MIAFLSTTAWSKTTQKDLKLISLGCGNGKIEYPYDTYIDIPDGWELHSVSTAKNAECYYAILTKKKEEKREKVITVFRTIDDSFLKYHGME